MQYVSGQMLTPEGFRPGHVGYEDGIVLEVGEGLVETAEAEGLIVPTFINAHTHLADLKVPIDLDLPLEEAVAPPNGLKYRYLAEAPDDEIRSSFSTLSRKMAKNGTSRFIDFREGGVKGAKLLKGIGKGGGAKPFIMGRPKDRVFDKEEMTKLLDTVHGVGVSSITDWPYEELEALADFVRSHGMPFALHASERIREDIDKVLDLKPSFLVHMTKATRDDMDACRDADVPVVVCPRSNLFFGSIPPLKEMVESGLKLALGTDNAMTTLPDMMTEMEFAARILRSQGGRSMRPILDMALLGGRLILNEVDSIGIAPGSPCEFMVLRSYEGDPVTNITLRSGERDVRFVCLGKYTWRGWR
ncbi:MAG: chlorohydrolase [Methanomassiliicoccales archaeon PtaU1.Bin124]|nr:MAG: chlorohydrolase [Methanomassiliicoccales archaeon PtaU1.Bin124]